MHHDHRYDCPVCGSHLESKDELNRHCERAHPDTARSASSGERGNATPPHGDPLRGNGSRNPS